MFDLDVFDEMSKIFDGPFFGNVNTVRKYSVPSFPPVRIVKRDKKISFKFALAGYSKKDIEINFGKDCLILSTTKEFNTSKGKEDVADNKVIVDNFKTPSFSYKYFIPSDKFDFEKTEASFEDGILYINIPASEKVEKKLKKIEIK